MIIWNDRAIFYEEILHQKIVYNFGESILFEGGFAIHLKSHFKNLICNKEIKLGNNNFELYFEFNDIETIFCELKKQQITFLHEICEQPWRQKVIRIYDLDKNIIEIGESIEFLCKRMYEEGILMEEIARITNMTEEYVRNLLE